MLSGEQSGGDTDNVPVRPVNTRSEIIIPSILGTPARRSGEMTEVWSGDSLWVEAEGEGPVKVV